MVQVNLKRKYENNSCTHGILTIPAYNFKCLTLELCDGDNKVYKQDCRISEGMYPLVQGYAQGWPMFPVLKKKPKGFARKPGLASLEAMRSRFFCALSMSLPMRASSLSTSTS